MGMTLQPSHTSQGSMCVFESAYQVPQRKPAGVLIVIALNLYIICLFTIAGSFPRWNLKLVPVRVWRDRRGRILRIGGGSFNKQRNLHVMFVPDSLKTNRSPHLPTRILRVYIEALTGFSHIFSPDDLNIFLSQGCILETAPNVEMVGEMYIPRIEEGVRSLQQPGCSSRVSWWSCPPDDLFEQLYSVFWSINTVYLCIFLDLL